MKPHELVIELFRKHVPHKEQDMASIENEANAWASKIDENDTEKFNKAEIFYAKMSRKWGVKLLMMFLYVIGVRWLTNFMYEPVNREELED